MAPNVITEGNPFLFSLKFIQGLGMSLSVMCQYSCLSHYRNQLKTFLKRLRAAQFPCSPAIHLPSTPPFPSCRLLFPFPFGFSLHFPQFEHFHLLSSLSHFPANSLEGLIFYHRYCYFLFSSKDWKGGAEIFGK